MKPSCKRLHLWLLALSIALSPALHADSTGLRDLAGGRLDPATLPGQGEWLVMMFWSASCGVCQQEAPSLEDFQQVNRAGQVRVVGISVDGREGGDVADGFVREHGLSFTNLLAEGEEAALLFHDATGDYLIGTPAFVVYDPAGTLRAYRQGTMNFLALQRLVDTPVRIAEENGR